MNSYFQRSTVREHLVFASRTTAARCPKGSRITIKLKEVPYQCHCYRRVDGLTGIVVSDNEYQERVAHSLIAKLLKEFENKFANQWNKVKSDTDMDFAQIGTLLKEYQNPEKADKMLKLQKNLDEIKDIMHKNIEEVELWRDHSLNQSKKRKKKKRKKWFETCLFLFFFLLLLWCVGNTIDTESRGNIRHVTGEIG